MNEARTDEGGRAAPAQWFEFAEQLEIALRGVESGGRERAIAAFGSSRRLSVGTLRNYAAARRYLTDLETSDSELSVKLRSVPVNAVAALARWSSYDRAAALAAAHRLAEGKLSVRALDGEERRSRAGARAGITPKMAFFYQVQALGGIWWSAGNPHRVIDLSTAKREYADQSLRKEFGDFIQYNFEFGGYLFDPSPEERKNLRIDLLAGSGRTQVAILIVGPYSNHTYYVTRATDWLLKATGVSRFRDRVALVLPQECPIEPYYHWMSDNPLSETQPSVFIVHQGHNGELKNISSSVINDHDLIADGF